LQGGIGLLVRRRQQPPADLQARGFRLRRTYQACRDIALDLGELILVDGGLVATATRATGQPQRQQHGEDRRRCHQREHKPQGHRASSGSARLTRASCAALHQPSFARQLTIINSPSGQEIHKTKR
jgi:hypothetical protein